MTYAIPTVTGVHPKVEKLFKTILELLYLEFSYWRLGTWYLVRGTCYVVLGTWYLLRGTWYVVRGTWYVVLGTWYLVRDTFHMTKIYHVTDGEGYSKNITLTETCIVIIKMIQR